MDLPKKYNAEEAEPKWQKYWEKNNIYKFNPDSKAEIYSVDMPPPTVSGKMHIGHAFSYSQQDFIVRFQRMLGKNVFYPFGLDDNGLATERLIEKMKKVKGSKMDREDFVKLCEETVEKELRPEYIRQWKRIGMSCDWSIFYTTINKHSRKISQRSFIDLYNDGRIYRKKSPMTICPQCQTAIAQVETEDEEKKSTLNYIKAKLEDTKNEFLIFATTRPELLHSCVGMTMKQDGNYVKAKKDKEIWIMSKEAFEKFKDEWNLTLDKEVKGKKIINKIATIPISNAKIEVEHDIESKTEYGSGIVYWCTYGGADCVEFLLRHKDAKPIHIMDINGKYNSLTGNLEGLNSIDARKQILEDLEKDGSLVKKENIKHSVNVHERCGTDVEYVATEQWFIKYLDLKDKFLEDGSRLNWYPHHMKHRLDNWIKGLKWDWCISRQRFFGVPFPMWYCKNCSKVILAKKEDLPVDPLKHKPPIKECKCGCKEFIPEKDILDTWATSSLTPQLCTELFKDKPIFKKLFPMSLRPQAHDIITFWLFNTMVKSQLHYNVNPWKDVVISGHALDPHGRKMSKSKGNVVEPQIVIEKYSSDALRFWAAGSKLGDDLPYQEKDIVTGQKMITKLWNASKFTIMHLEDYKGKKPKKLETIDLWLLTKLNKIIKGCTEDFERYEYAKTKLETEKFFWHTLCDNYLEIVKDRLYNPDKRGIQQRLSAQYTLHQATLSVLKLMAPIMPHVTEEIYHLYFNKKEKKKSIHISQWPKYNEKEIDKNSEKIGDFIVKVVSEVRKKKNENKLSLKDPIKKIKLKADFDNKLFETIVGDLKAVTSAEEIDFSKGKDSIDIEL